MLEHEVGKKYHEKGPESPSRRRFLQTSVIGSIGLLIGTGEATANLGDSKIDLDGIISHEEALIRKEEAIEKLRLSEEIIGPGEMEFFYNFFLPGFTNERVIDRSSASNQELTVRIIEKIQNLGRLAVDGVISAKVLRLLYERYYFDSKYKGSFYNEPRIPFSQERHARWKVYGDTINIWNTGEINRLNEEVIFSDSFFQGNSGKPYVNNQPIGGTFICEDLHDGVRVPEGLEFPKIGEPNTLMVYHTLGFCVLGLYDQKGRLIVLTDSKLVKQPEQESSGLPKNNIQGLPYSIAKDNYLIFGSHVGKDFPSRYDMYIEVPLYYMSKIYAYAYGLGDINIQYNGIKK